VAAAPADALAPEDPAFRELNEEGRLGYLVTGMGGRK
jgi:hypothetical protein